MPGTATLTGTLLAGVLNVILTIIARTASSVDNFCARTADAARFAGDFFLPVNDERLLSKSVSSGRA
jgi:hypothetical protein